MWERLDFSLRRYEQIRPARAGEKISFAGEAFGSWIRDDVCPTVQRLLDRQDFCRLARWPLDHLQPGAQTPERQLVENVERELLAGARRLAEIVNVAAVRTALLAEIQASSSSTLPGAEATGEDSPVTIAGYIATRPWLDLMSIYDYFGPAMKFNLQARDEGLKANGRQPQWAIFTPYCAPDLRLPGDYISRMLRIRIEHWHLSLQKLSVRCQAIHRQQNAPPEVREALRTCLGLLPVAIRELDNALVYDPQAKLRQACMCLVQVYSAYHSSADLSWLGAAAEMKSWASHFVHVIEKRENQELVDRIAGSLAEMAELMRSPVPIDLIIEERILDTPLVLIQTVGRNEIYWQGELLDFDIERSRSAWTMMVALVRKVRREQAVDETDDLGISLKDAKYRLKKCLPADLHELVQSTRGSHRLALTAEQIFAYPQDLREHATRTTYGGA